MELFIAEDNSKGESEKISSSGSPIEVEDRCSLKQWEEFKAVMGLDLREEKVNHEALKVVNQFLADRTTLGGTHITEADKLLFNWLYQSVASLTLAEKENCVHLSRYFDYLQNQRDFLGSREKISFSKIPLYF